MRILLSLALLTSLSLSQAQIKFEINSLSFGDVTVGTSSEEELTITNISTKPITLDVYSPFQEFQPTNAQLVVASGGNETLRIAFTPRHNIRSNGEIVIKTNSAQGDLRIHVEGDGRNAGNYYTGTFNLYDEELKSELKSIISKGYVNLGYNSARDYMYATLDNEGGTVSCVYTGRKANFTTRSGANSASFNCEHTWPQSLFNSREPEKADIHHLFPTYANANSQRGNLPFGEVSSSTWSDGGSMKGGGNFEVRDDHKGDCARSMMYFSLRYGNLNGFLTNQESTLRKWSNGDALSDKETKRNEGIYQRQKNRNPFVDHPEFLERIASLSSNSVRPLNPSFWLSQSEVAIQTVWSVGSDTFRLQLINDGNTELEVEQIKWNSDNFESIESPGKKLSQGEGLTIHVLPKDLTSTGVKSDTLHMSISGSDVKIPIHLEILKLFTRELSSNAKHMWTDSKALFVDANGNSELKIYTLQGKLVHFSEIRGALTEIKTDSFTSGIYIALLDSGNSRESLRFLVP